MPSRDPERPGSNGEPRDHRLAARAFINDVTSLAHSFEPVGDSRIKIRVWNETESDTQTFRLLRDFGDTPLAQDQSQGFVTDDTFREIVSELSRYLTEQISHHEESLEHATRAAVGIWTDTRDLGLVLFNDRILPLSHSRGGRLVSFYLSEGMEDRLTAAGILPAGNWPRFHLAATFVFRFLPV
ncbi:hypothetical protein A2Z33_02090 [Candidatus Gottesmanbacteria bacterium RBG_16_52_11]|uniref:Uncharacterized protein n=1 Tax=Candidatus Gottesmanbacteria bacterium RBG_16_52_11 TaxID=1798374 RepID=A0A1F5YQV6_9BACT|nr:MAG: hypothetical protein A2Z33_02090 [Candidatus Gottesmanbacteria bacterium RBG_16_52_11]